MAAPRLSTLELKIMEILWAKGESSIRAIQQTFPEKTRPAYGTIQTTIYRMEVKRVIRRIGKIGNFHIFEPLFSRDTAQLRLFDELLAMFGGRSQLLMMHLVKSGKLTLADVKEVERELKKVGTKG